VLRFSLDASERGLVPLADELKIVGDYLEIERARLGSRLTFTLDIDPEAAGREVPPLTIQTLVENSVKHAVAPRPTGGRIRVAASLAGERLVLSVWDDGPGFTAAAMRPGHGLEGLQTRLAARFGAAAELTIASRDGGTLVTVTVRGRKSDAVTTAPLLRAFLLDDEPLALKRLARMLAATGRVEIVGQATDPDNGLAQIAAQPVDVLFLDIHMPGLDGFQVVERVPAGPLVIFTTAHDQHAVRAFEVNAIDYLLKPVERERLDRALDRVTQRRADSGGATCAARSSVWPAICGRHRSWITWPRAFVTASSSYRSATSLTCLPATARPSR
jgi:CheY-like chemotaxis protein